MTKESPVASAESAPTDPAVTIKAVKPKESPQIQTSEDAKLSQNAEIRIQKSEPLKIQVQATEKTKQPQKEPQKEKKKGPKGIVLVFPDWCKACGICVFYCPTDTIASAPDGKTIVQNPETCIACMQCDYRCPDYAITVKPINNNNGGDN